MKIETLLINTNIQHKQKYPKQHSIKIEYEYILQKTTISESIYSSELRRRAGPTPPHVQELFDLSICTILLSLQPINLLLERSYCLSQHVLDLCVGVKLISTRSMWLLGHREALRECGAQTTNAIYATILVGWVDL